MRSALEGLMNFWQCRVLYRVYDIVLSSAFLAWKTHVFLSAREGGIWMRTFCALGSLQGNTDVQSQRDASKVTYLELSVRQEMKRKWSERQGMSLPPALLDVLMPVSFSPAADGGRKLPETLLSFKLSLKHWPTAYWAENGRTPIDSCGLRISTGTRFNKHQKCNGIPLLLKDQDGNVFITRFIKDSSIILVRFLRGQLCICQPDTNKTGEGNVKQ